MHAYLSTAINAAQNAGAIIMNYREQMHTLEISEKGIRDAVTSADKDAEAEIIRQIKTQFPTHSILAEESGLESGSDAEVVWIIDPLDGTNNFINGVPYFCVAIGVQVNGQLEHAAIFNPLNNELFYASLGEGAYLNGKKLQVSRCANMQRALLATNFAVHATQQLKAEVMQRFEAAIDVCSDVRCTGSSALNLAEVAAGRYAGYWGAVHKPWDMAAAALLIQEAGGKVSDYAGEDDFLYSGKIIAATPNIHAALLETIGVTKNQHIGAKL